MGNLKKPFVIIFLATLILFIPIFINPSLILNRGNDLEEFFWPIYYFVKNQILINHQFPLWNNLILSGTPLLPDPQSPLFYLPNIIFLLLPLNTAFIASIFIHILFAGTFFYLCARKGFKFSGFASLVGSLLYIFSPKLAGYLEAGHVGLIFSWTWIPLVILSVKMITEKPKINWSIVLGVSLALIFFLHTITFLIAVAASLVFFTVLSFKNWKYILLALLISFGLTAVTLLPQFEWQGQTNRYLLLTVRDVYPKWSSIGSFLKAIIAPWLGGINNVWKYNSENWLTFGIVPLLLATLGFLKTNKKIKIILLCAAILICLIGLNNASPVYSILIKNNFYALMRVATRFWFLAVIIVILLATHYLNIVSKNKKQKVVTLLIVFLALIESLLFSWKYMQKPYFKADYAPKEVYEFLQKDTDRFRVFCTTRCLSQKQAAIYNLELIDGYSTLTQKNYYSYSFQLTGAYWDYYSLSTPPIGAYTLEQLQPEAKPLGENNTKYVISPHTLTDKSYELTTKIDRYFIYLNKLYKPRSPVPIIIYSSNLIRIDTSNYNNKSVIISEVYSPGWKAYLNGKGEVLVQETPISQRLIDIPANTRFVDFKYQPNSYKIGIIITTTTVMSLLFYWYIHNVRRKTSFS